MTSFKMAVDLHELPVFWSLFTDTICTMKPNMLFIHRKQNEERKGVEPEIL